MIALLLVLLAAPFDGRDLHDDIPSSPRLKADWHGKPLTRKTEPALIITDSHRRPAHYIGCVEACPGMLSMRKYQKLHRDVPEADCKLRHWPRPYLCEWNLLTAEEGFVMMDVAEDVWAPGVRFWTVDGPW